MMNGMDYQQCDIVLVPFQNSDMVGEKSRPVLVISNKFHDWDNNDFIGCMITKNLRNISGKCIKLEPKHFELCNLTYESLLKPCHLLTIRKDAIMKRIGKLKKDIVKQAVEEIKKVIELQQ